RRKRIAANIIDEYNNPSSSTSEQISTEFTIRKSREKVLCFCSHCNGKMIDLRMKEEHEQMNEQMTSLEPLNRDKAPMSQELVELINSTILLAELQDTTMSIDTHSNNDMYEEQKYIFLPRKKKAKPGIFRHITEVELVAEDSSYNVPAEYDMNDIYTSESSTQEDSPNDEDNDFSDNFENYSHPMFDIPDISDTSDISELPTDELIKGILIWIMKFRSSHNIPNTAIEELIQFIKIILKVCKNINYKSFSNSLYMLKKNYAKFSNSATKRLKQCCTPLGKKISSNNSISIVPESIYPVLRIAKWITKRIWIDEDILTEKALQSIQKKMSEFKLLSVLRRISGKIHCGEGFSNFTTDQWCNFFLIYATVVLWNHLLNKDRKILTYFVRVCTILVRRIVKINDMKEAHELLVKIIKLIEKHYGEGKIMPNLHLSLHLYKCSYDYKPLYSFWCFSFERMNGILGSLPNSHCQIESELICQLMTKTQINDIISSSLEVIGIKLLNKQPSISSLSEFPTNEMYQFLINSRNILESPVTGCEEFLDSILRKLFTENLPNLTIVINKANRYERCQIGAKIFGFAAATRHIKSSFVLAKFINRDGNSIDIYPSQIQFFLNIAFIYSSII
ncbi:hypothetical protein RclHR1_06740001, partial [Rhizophagus clarus]